MGKKSLIGKIAEKIGKKSAPKTKGDEIETSPDAPGSDLGSVTIPVAKVRAASKPAGNSFGALMAARLEASKERARIFREQNGKE